MTLIPAAQTFLNAPAASLDEVRPGQVAVAGVPHDSTHNTRFGARFGPDGIRLASASLGAQLEEDDGFFDTVSLRNRRFAGTNALVDVGDLRVHPTDVMAMTENVRHGVAELRRKGAFPVTMGGDHYVTYPSFLGFADDAARVGVTRVGYIQLDGHLDFNDNNPVWGKYFHGSNARRVSEHELVRGENMVWIGIQGYVPSSVWSTIQRMGGTVFTHEDVRALGMREVARRAAEIASRGCQEVYVTVDIDVIDAGYSPGTGGVVISGVEPVDLLRAVDEIVRSAPIGAADVMEVAPNLDLTGRTVRIAAETVLRLAGHRLLPDI
jgi:arginase family enzyme